MELDALFERLWKDYASQNPSAQGIYDLFTAEGETVENDHIAFRTFNDPRVNIEVLSRPFINAGYEPKGEYTFETKHLKAIHFEHSEESHRPRVFISELILEDFSKSLQETVKDLLDGLPGERFKPASLVYEGTIWETPSKPVYEQLKEESEYAAWLYVYGFRANHFTVSVNSLKNYDTIEKVNDFLKNNGYPLNTSGGEIKGTPQQLLEQSSTLADIIAVDFREGTYEIPACYYEFARRYPDKDGKLYTGFIAKSADKIFESTDFRKPE